MSTTARYFSLAYNSAAVSESIALKTDYHSVRLIKESGTINPGKNSYTTNVLLCGNCIDKKTRKLYVMYIDTFYGAAWIIEIGIDDRVQKVVLYDKDNAIGFDSLFKIYNPRVVNGRIIFTDNKNHIYQIDIERAKASHHFGIGYSNYPTTEWNAYTAYAITQIVSFGKYFYKALVENPSVEPGNDESVWQRLCSVEDAYYSTNIENFYFAPMPPKMPPIVEYISDDSRRINNLKQTLYQFAYRYVYMDWRKSTLSPASIVPLPQAEEETSTGLANEMISINNSLRVRVNLGGEEVRAVEVVARSSDDPSTWFLVDTIEKFEDQEKGGIISRITNVSYISMGISVLPPTVVNQDGPGTPVANAATGLLSTGFTASWSIPTGTTGFYLDIATDAAFTTFVAGYQNRDMNTESTFNVRGLTSNVTYYYRVRAYNFFGLVSKYSNVISVSIVLNAPVALPHTNMIGTGFTANWTGVEGATGYYLDVAEDAAFTIFVAGYNNKNIGALLSSAIVGLVVDTPYYYRVRAYNALATSVNSNVITTVTRAPAADVVAIAATDVSTYYFTAKWNVAANSVGYFLDVATDAGFTSFVTGFNNRYVGNVLSYQVATLASDTPYYYRVRAISQYNVLSLNYSNTITQRTLLFNPTAKDATYLLSNGFTANWDSVAGATGYRIDVAMDAAFVNYVLGYQDLDAGNVLSLAVTGLATTQFYYRVRAYNGFQTSSNSNTIYVQIMAAASDPIATPATAIALDSFVANWDAASGAVGYYLDVSTDPAFGSFVDGYQSRSVGNVVSHQVTGIVSNTTYYYRLRSVTVQMIFSDYSNIVIARTLLEAPVMYAAFNVTSISFIASWTGITGAVGYYLDVATDAGFINMVPGYNNRNIGSLTSHTVAGLTLGTLYYYRVRAYNYETTSANSDVVSVTTIGATAAPVATAATLVTSSSITLNWGAVAGAVGYYIDIATDAAFTLFVTGFQNKDVGNVTSFLGKPLSSSTQYYYRVRTYNAYGLISVSSNTITATTSVSFIPAAPVATAASAISSGSVTANWNASVGATGYYIDVATDNTFGSFVYGFNNRNVGNVTSFIVSGLAPGTAYYYRIRAYNTEGVSGGSNIITTATNAADATYLTLTPASWNFGGSGLANSKVIQITTNALSWDVDASVNGKMFIYQYIGTNAVEIYFEGANGEEDFITFNAIGPGGSVSTTFYGYWT